MTDPIDLARQMLKTRAHAFIEPQEAAEAIDAICRALLATDAEIQRLRSDIATLEHNAKEDGEDIERLNSKLAILLEAAEDVLTIPVSEADEPRLERLRDAIEKARKP